MDEIKDYEEKWAIKSQTMQERNAANNAESVHKLDFVDFLYSLSPKTEFFIPKACIGFCVAPKYPMYKSRSEVGNSEKGYDLCGPMIIQYLEAFKELFSKYCYWHCRLCLMQICIAMLQYFKMPADTSHYDARRAEQEKKEWLDKILEQAAENLDHMM